MRRLCPPASGVLQSGSTGAPGSLCIRPQIKDEKGHPLATCNRPRPRARCWLAARSHWPGAQRAKGQSADLTKPAHARPAATQVGQPLRRASTHAPFKAAAQSNLAAAMTCSWNHARHERHGCRAGLHPWCLGRLSATHSIAVQSEAEFWYATQQVKKLRVHRSSARSMNGLSPSPTPGR